MKLEEFQTFTLADDKFANDKPALKFDDLLPRYDGEIKLSYMMSTYNRGAQLSRSLETLCRQEWREFEVLINDDGSTQDIKGIVDKFSPYLNIRYFYTERPQWVSCPSKAFKMMFEHCQGEVFAISHPEMMLGNKAMYYLYNCAFPNYIFRNYISDDVVYSHLNDYDINKLTEDDWIWVTLKPLYIDEFIYFGMNFVDWHSDLDNLKDMPGWERSIGLSNEPNSFHMTRTRCPWWFVASARRECPIWEEMPVFQGHASVDMWFITYRHYKNVVDCTPKPFLCYHQAHATSAFAPDSEDTDFRKLFEEQ